MRELNARARTTYRAPISGHDLALDDFLAGFLDLFQDGVIRSGAFDLDTLVIETDVVGRDAVELAEHAADSTAASAAAHLDVEKVLVLCAKSGSGARDR